MKKQHQEKQEPVKGTDVGMINILQGTVSVCFESVNRAQEYVRHEQIRLEKAIKRLDNYKEYGDPDYGMEGELE